MTPLTAESVAGGSVGSSTRVMICSSRGGAFGVWETSIEFMAVVVSGLSPYAHARDCLTVLQTNTEAVRPPKKPTSVECGGWQRQSGDKRRPVDLVSDSGCTSRMIILPMDRSRP